MTCKPRRKRVIELGRRKTKKPKEPNWRKIEIEYVTTDISQRKLAEKHGVSYNTLKRKSAEGGWVEKKHEHHRKVTAKTMDDIADAQARDMAELINIADKHIEVMSKLYDDPDQFRRHIVEESDEDSKYVTEKLFNKYDTKAMRDCALQLEKMLSVYRDIHDLPNQQQREAQRIAAEKLELEKTKVAMENDGPKTLEVVFENANVEDWSG